MKAPHLVVALALALASGCRPAQAPPEGAPPRLVSQKHGIDGTAWLGAVVAQARAAGAGPVEILGADVSSEGDRIGSFIDVPDKSCVLAVARGSPTVIDLDLYAFEEDGSAFATDESPEQHATLLLCPPGPRRLYVAARVVAGAGIVTVGVMAVAKASAPRVQKATRARAQGSDDGAASDGWPGIDARVRAHRGTLGGRWDELRRVVMPVDPHAASRLTTVTEAGRCIDVFLTPSDELSSIEALAEDGKGRIIAPTRAIGRDRGIVLCSRGAWPVTITVRPRSAAGLVAVSIARSAVGGEAEISAHNRVVHVGPSLELDRVKADHAKDLATLGYPAAKAVGSGTARVGMRTSLPLDLPAGCARVDVLVGRPFTELSAALWDDHGGLTAQTHSAGAGVLFACGKGGAARVDLEPLESAGPFAVEVRRERVAPPALVAHPIAAGRLLGRLAAGGVLTDAAAAASAQVVALEPGVLKTTPVVVPPNVCSEVVVAVDAGGAGLDVRLVDASSREGDVVRGAHVVSGRLCGATSGARGVAEIRLETGRADALVLVRPRG